MKIGLETESCHLFFQHGLMNIFDFIRRTWELGLDGVEINIIPDLNLHPELGCLSGDDDIYLQRVRRTIEYHGLYCEIDTRLTDPAHLERALYIAHKLNADVVRTYINKNEYSQHSMSQAVQDIRSVIPLLKKYRIKLGIENHEYETSDEIIDVIKQTDSPWVGAHCDIGNAMMAWEDPVEAVRKLAPYTCSTHFKDHIVCLHDDIPVVTGVPVGEGSIDTEECFRILVENSMVTRINIETCYPYASVFDREKGTGGVCSFSGAFEIKPPPFPAGMIKPLDYYYPHQISQEALKQLLNAQGECVKKSAQALKKLRNKYCGE
ncbi:sugar phosphate isomerase/epimerase [Salmonella enterica subsp. diarizonae]|uniref:Sugar phosphate isomerase/epimerase n=1 Tax=Salmonella diarizonae TaxID=59204 RepID=A0A6C8Y2G3_SALDZ|nr:sugar phosphate isomerase/epimerase [Salmonella enterica subsp. enterica serovar Newport]MIE71848.1 sugar phosphate isomerase/epimerase [Salmonella enterica subsp. diarizonae]